MSATSFSLFTSEFILCVVCEQMLDLVHIAVFYTIKGA